MDDRFANIGNPDFKIDEKELSLNFRKYSETSMAKEMAAEKEKPRTVGEIMSAMNDEEITDYSRAPMTKYTNWKLLLEMNDKPGPFKNMLTFEKRQDILLKIHNWEKQNLGNIG